VDRNLEEVEVNKYCILVPLGQKSLGQPLYRTCLLKDLKRLHATESQSGLPRFNKVSTIDFIKLYVCLHGSIHTIQDLK